MLSESERESNAPESPSSRGRGSLLDETLKVSRDNADPASPKLDSWGRLKMSLSNVAENPKESLVDAIKIATGYMREIPSSQQNSRWIVSIHPLSIFSRSWEFVSGILLMYSTAVTPLLISFYSEQEGYCGHAPTIGLDMFVDVFFILEILVHFQTGRLVKGDYIYRTRAVMKEYMHLKRGEFAVDIMASAPFSWLEFFVVPDEDCNEQGDTSAVVRYLRVVRMFRMLRLFKVLKIFDVLRDLFRLRPSLLRLFKAAFSICLIAHIGACGWWYIKVQETGNSDEFRLEYQVVQSSVSSAYLTSIYFMLATLCTVGYGDISATTDPERLFAIMAMLVGASAFAIIVSNMSALAASMQSEENKHMEKMDTVIDFLRQHNLSRELERRVESFFQFKSTQKFNFEMRSDVLEGLPSGLVRRIKLELNSQLVKSTFLFDKMERDHIEQIVDKLDVALKSPEEKILRHGSLVEGLYIVVSGAVDLLLPHPTQKGRFDVVETIKEGGVFGEEGPLLHVGTPFEVVAKTFVELCFLSAEGFEEVAPGGRSSQTRKKLRGLAAERSAHYHPFYEWKISQWVPKKQNAEGRWVILVSQILRRFRRRGSHGDAQMQRLAKFTTAEMHNIESDEELAADLMKEDSMEDDERSNKDAIDLGSVAIYPGKNRSELVEEEEEAKKDSLVSEHKSSTSSSRRQLTPPPSAEAAAKRVEKLEEPRLKSGDKFKGVPDDQLHLGSPGRFPSIKKLSEFAEDIEGALYELSMRLRRTPDSELNGSWNGTHSPSDISEDLGFEDTNILTDAQVFGEGVAKLASRFKKLRRDWESKPEVPKHRRQIHIRSPELRGPAQARPSKMEIGADYRQQSVIDLASPTSAGGPPVKARSSPPIDKRACVAATPPQAADHQETETFPPLDTGLPASPVHFDGDDEVETPIVGRRGSEGNSTWRIDTSGSALRGPEPEPRWNARQMHENDVDAS